MKATVVLAIFASLALAADHVPVTIENFDPDFDTNCGKVTVSGRDTYNAIAWAMSLNQNGETLTSSDGNEYPDEYKNLEKFKWVSSECDGTNLNSARQGMPIIKGGFFGEDGNNDAGLYRAVYFYNGAQDAEGHPKGFYCGTIYHNDPNSNGFAGCDVTT